MGELAETVTTDLGVLAKENQQSLGVERVGAPRCVGDHLVLRQALINLVGNAITAPGPVESGHRRSQ